MKTKQENQMEWLQNEVKKDQENLEREKLNFIQQIKKLKKEELLPIKKEKISLWQRIKTVLKIR
jgi:hypothetical protein